MSESIDNYPTQQEIEQRAYEIYLERGAQDGGDVDDWLAAEAELTAEQDREQEEVADSAPQFFQQGNSIAADEAQTANAEKMLEELYERSRAAAAGSSS